MRAGVSEIKKKICDEDEDEDEDVDEDMRDMCLEKKIRVGAAQRRSCVQ